MIIFIGNCSVSGDFCCSFCIMLWPLNFPTYYLILGSVLGRPGGHDKKLRGRKRKETTEHYFWAKLHCISPIIAT